ncbi:MAG: hypothetical protein HDS50_04360 [Bacteroides sp.]|nr:hypothetical protein [Barnesiella sp.]MBD5256853.1 hypothetical protein [Bacteroides sp.]
MTKEISEWNGYAVYGDIRELDNLCTSAGIIALDKHDIITVLSADGENYVTSCVNANLGEAFNNAVNSLPCKIDKVNNLLIDFRCGNKQLKMSELSSITATLSDANPDIDIRWGMSSDDSSDDLYKVVLLASVK